MKTKSSSSSGPPKPPKKAAKGLGDEPPEDRTIDLSDPIAVGDLAKILQKNRFRILADLIALRVYVKNDRAPVTFDIAAQIARKHGYLPRRKVR